jgi:hypothetical protein
MTLRQPTLGSIRDCFLVHVEDVGGYEQMDGNEENSKTTVA